MNEQTKTAALKIALLAFGVVFLLIYPIGIFWPAGWVWHGGEGSYYLQMIWVIYGILGVYLILAARDPSKHRSLINFTAVSSAGHAGVMAIQAMGDEHEMGHMIGDIPALFLVAIVLGYLNWEKPTAAAAA
jgi:hypothetical protein